MFLKFVPTSCTGIKTRFNKFKKLAPPGLNLYIPFIENIYLVSNKLTQNTFKFTVKTRDNIFSDISVAIQHKVKTENTELAFYSLHNPHEQIKAYTENTLRSIISRMSLNELFESQDTICYEVSNNLSKIMEKNGYTIENSLVTEIKPAKNIEEALNHIEAAKRAKEAAIDEAEAKYILKIREAEADRDKDILKGQGISGQRFEILKGYEESVLLLSNKLNIKPEIITQFILNIQHLETMEKIGTSNNTKTMFVQHDIKDFQKQILEAYETKN